MATTATPTGAEPTDTLSASGSFTGKVRHIKVASGYGTAIFYGDFVKLVNTGTVEKDTGTTSATPVGVFVGCAYTSPSTGEKTFSQYFPASTAADDIVAYVVDDPNVLMRMQSDEAIAQTGLGNNAAIVQTAGSTSIGRSKNAVDGSSIATTNTLPLRIIDFVDGPTSAVGDTYTDVIVKFNAGHQYSNTTGV
jgi:hypothetical protein